MRYEFTQKTKDAALERSGGRCEAHGDRYGLPPGVRCQRAIFKGRVNFDHWPRGAHDPSPETRSLGNCVATCPECNQYANNKHDTPREAKMKRVKHDRDTHVSRMAAKAGIEVPAPAPTRKPRPKMRGRAFAKIHRPMQMRKK